MCIGNRASSSSYYINKQVESLWEISNECVKKHGYGLKPTRVEVEYGSCLAQLCVGKHRSANPSVDDLVFFASFGAPPQLKFICNHELVLLFHVKAGHYKLEGKNSPQHFQGYTCAFRVQFREHIITDSDYSAFGQTTHCKTKIIVLDLHSATFIRDLSAFESGNKISSEKVDRHHKNIVKYLSTHYLPLLRKAGFHCIHSLPDFDNLSRTHLIDYSAINDIEIETSEIFGISVEEINKFLTGRWLEAAAHVDNLEEDHDHSLAGHFALAEHRGVCEDIHFHAFFGPPQIHVRCSKEVILYIDVQDLTFYMDGGFHSETTHKASNWKIAFIIEATLVEEDEGNVRRIRLDFSRARYFEGRSICTSETIEETILIKLRTVFLQYITQRYFFILEEHEHHHVYRHDDRVIEVEEDLYDDGEYEGGGNTESSGVTEFREHLTITETFGFDIITTVTQGSINDHFRSLWRASQATNGCLSSWAYGEFFDASFGPLQIQFPCNPRSHTVIVYVNILEGYLTNLGEGKKCVTGEKHEFTGWKLAFEVTLKQRDYSKAHAISDSSLRVREHIGEYILKQLVLDFDTARVRYDLSRLQGLFEGSKAHLTRSKCGALLHYITHFYFGQLAREGLHVLYSVPTWKEKSSCSLIKYAPSSFDFQFFPAPYGGDKVVSCLFGHQRNFGDRNMLIMCGMVDPTHRPTLPLQRCSWRWTTSEQRFSGMFALSRAAFLDGWLLHELVGINRRTTLVPVFHGIGDAGAWDIELVKWSDHPFTKDRLCAWKEVGQCKEGLEFQWKYRDEWTYAHQGDSSHIYNGGYSVSCNTTNSLILPAVNRHDVCEIKVQGKIDLKLAFDGGEKNWSTSASARWSATITLTSDAHGTGLKVTPHSSIDLPNDSGFIGNREMVHVKFRDAAALLQKQLSKVEFIEEQTIHGLETAFSGVWPLFYSGAYGYTLANPVFNSHGDLLFEMVSPLDRDGCIVTSEKARHDICLPKKLHTKSRYIKESTSLGSSLSTIFSTIASTFESPLGTPYHEKPSSNNHLASSWKATNGDTEHFAEDDTETIHGDVQDMKYQVYESTMRSNAAVTEVS